MLKHKIITFTYIILELLAIELRAQSKVPILLRVLGSHASILPSLVPIKIMLWIGLIHNLLTSLPTLETNGFKNWPLSKFNL